MGIGSNSFTQAIDNISSVNHSFERKVSRRVLRTIKPSQDDGGNFYIDPRTRYFTSRLEAPNAKVVEIPSSMDPNDVMKKLGGGPDLLFYGEDNVVEYWGSEFTEGKV